MFDAPLLLLLLFTWLLAVPPAAAQSDTLSQSSPPLSQPVIEVAAFRVAPVMPGAQDIRRKAATAGNPLSSPASAAADEKVLETRVQAAELWVEILQRVLAGLNLPPLANDAAGQLALLPQPLPGKFLRARSMSEGLAEIEYIVKPDEAYTFSIRGSSIQVRPHSSDPRLIERMRADPSKASLFTATDAMGLPENIALQLTEIFAGNVDFHRELHHGYRCAIVYEAHYREGFIERSGRILAAELEIGERRYQAYHAQDAQGRGAYFDVNGKATRRMFRRSPVEFTRITSDYTLARFHPVLGIWRAHRGVDYAAPLGTKVMAVADGVVDFVGTQVDYGNLIVLRHRDLFITYYAHLRETAAGLSAGSKVEQGQTIGLVGMTGLATAPHLHFEFHTRDAAGAWHAVPAPDIIESTVTAAPGFPALVQEYRNRLTVAATANYVILE